MARRLVSIIRTVQAPRTADYDLLWRTVRSAVEAAGSHAWGFVAAGDATRRIEFLEFAGGSDPRDARDVAEPLAVLEREFGGETEEWEEAG